MHDRLRGDRGPLRPGQSLDDALSGPAGVQGNSILLGAKIAAEQWNHAGGVLGRKIELVIRDDKASPAESALVGRGGMPW